MRLHQSEWPDGVVAKMTPLIITTAQSVRDISGVPMVPSPDPEAHVRQKNGTSRHDIGDDGLARLADATDLFLVDNKDAGKIWKDAQRVPGVGGFGIYFDTHLNGAKRVLIHIDNRPGRLMWVCPERNRATESRTYIYYRTDNPGPYLDILSAELGKL